jgi:hypothetical protein
MKRDYAAKIGERLKFLSPQNTPPFMALKNAERVIGMEIDSR